MRHDENLRNLSELRAGVLFLGYFDSISSSQNDVNQYVVMTEIQRSLYIFVAGINEFNSKVPLFNQSTKDKLLTTKLEPFTLNFFCSNGGRTWEVGKHRT